jgi:hypothetical protein
VLRRIFGPKRNEVMGQWRKLHSSELHNLYSSLDIIRMIKSRRMSWARHVARMGEGRNVYRVLVGEPEGKRPLGRSRSRWGMGSKWTSERWAGGLEWIHLAQDRDRLGGSCECGDEPSASSTMELVVPGNIKTESCYLYKKSVLI